jgi:hypothetical protein
MISEKDFEDIRPYHDEEINPALQRFVAFPEFFKILEFFFPGRNKEEIVTGLKNIHTARDFQIFFMHPLVYSVVNKTSAGLSYSGFENIVPGKPYLFVSNHRDIVLDSAILQILLVDNKHETSEITFGNNLLASPFIVDFGKINRMFIVYRSGNRMELFRNSQLLSAYIRHTLTKKKNSVWIAQRNGRTKDGSDRTETGLLKMFNISGACDLDESMSELNIVPLSISYEYEPCCALKVKETSTALKGQQYVKAPNEDVMSILSGITNFKGHIHLAVCKPVNTFLHESSEIASFNDRITRVAAGIDAEIFRNYRLWPGNYIAYDRLNGDRKNEQHYSPADEKAFSDYMEKELSSQNLTEPLHREVFLKIYANPVKNLVNL